MPAANPQLVHPTAVVDPQAVVHETVEIGPGAVIGGSVRVGPRVRIGPHAVVTGDTEIAEDVRLFAGAVVGEEPQDRAFDDARSYTRIGPRTVVREYVTIHRGTAHESETVVGADCYLMATCHVAHNCRIGDGVTIANGTQLAGHVQIGDHAFLSGNVCVHQFVRVGRRAMIGAGAYLPRDVPPFMMVMDERACGLNLIGLRRAGVKRAAVAELQELYDLFACNDRQLSVRLDDVAAHVTTPEGQELVDFLRSPGKRGIAPFVARSEPA